ncbi:aldo/keto reductase [Streptomyces sp. NPDC050504]|uniref:aldo/keto reductase n=1 Tax=Streptomyces sp. NPDC050504 TaxID=3365618 RepID=UPI003791C25C
MRYRTIGQDPRNRREVSVLSLGAMLLGSATDEETSFAILDRYVEAGGTFVDTANVYAYWVTGSQGGESERLLARWIRSRGIGDEITVATKLGARPKDPGTGYLDNAEGLGAKTVREAAERSREQLGLEKLPLLYAHIADPATPLEETVDAFAGLVAEGVVGLLGISNHWTWQVARAREYARAAGLPGYEVAQYHHTYFRRAADLPTRPSLEDHEGTVGGDMLSYLRADPTMSLVAYTPLLAGAYSRTDKPLGAEYDHPGTALRRAALAEVARETGATVNQVVLSWLIDADVPAIPLVGASSVAQLEESLEAVELRLTGEQRARLDGSGEE